MVGRTAYSQGALAGALSTITPSHLCGVLCGVLCGAKSPPITQFADPLRPLAEAAKGSTVVIQLSAVSTREAYALSPALGCSSSWEQAS